MYGQFLNYFRLGAANELFIEKTSHTKVLNKYVIPF